MSGQRPVPREFYDDLKARLERAESELAQYRTRYGVLVDQVVLIKRHEMGMHPPDFDPSKLDPVNALGEKTKAAIEEYSYGDPEQRNYLRNYALTETTARRAQGTAEDEIDLAVARRIAEGDSG